MRMLRYRPHVPNFGDDLNDVLWSALAPSLFAETSHDAGDEAFVGIGTIVGIDPGSSRRLHVFSSGAGYTGAGNWANCAVEYHCVRGPVTARVLGIDPDRVLTDGALLATAADTFQCTENRQKYAPTVVILHYETMAFPGWIEAVQAAGFDLIDPRGTPHDVIQAIKQAGLVLTESLHGAILADSFGVRWRGFATSRNFSTAKWADWTHSLGIQTEIALVPPPDPAQLFRFGKRPEPFGAMLALDLGEAVKEFHARIASAPHTPSLKVAAKRMIEALPGARKMFGFSVARTAQALAELANTEPCLSHPRRREALRDEMLSRLHALARRMSVSAGGGI